MTRGMKGCYVYCTDAALAQYFKKLLKNKNPGGSCKTGHSGAKRGIVWWLEHLGTIVILRMKECK